MISIMLLAIIMTGGMAFYNYSNSYLKAATYKRVAAYIANSKMEEIRQGVDGPLPNPAPEGLWGELADITVRTIPGKLGRYVYDDGPGGLKRVEVEVTWTQPGGSSPTAIRLSTYIRPE